MMSDLYMSKVTSHTPPKGPIVAAPHHTPPKPLMSDINPSHC